MANHKKPKSRAGGSKPTSEPTGCVKPTSEPAGGSKPTSKPAGGFKPSSEPAMVIIQGPKPHVRHHAFNPQASAFKPHGQPVIPNSPAAAAAMCQPSSKLRVTAQPFVPVFMSKPQPQASATPIKQQAPGSPPHASPHAAPETSTTPTKQHAPASPPPASPLAAAPALPATGVTASVTGGDAAQSPLLSLLQNAFRRKTEHSSMATPALLRPLMSAPNSICLSGPSTTTTAAATATGSSPFSTTTTTTTTASAPATITTAPTSSSTTGTITASAPATGPTTATTIASAPATTTTTTTTGPTASALLKALTTATTIASAPATTTTTTTTTGPTASALLKALTTATTIASAPTTTTTTTTTTAPTASALLKALTTSSMQRVLTTAQSCSATASKVRAGAPCWSDQVDQSRANMQARWEQALLDLAALEREEREETAGVQQAQESEWSLVVVSRAGRAAAKALRDTECY